MATKDERDHMGRVADLCCVVCRNEGLGNTPAMVHHIGNGTMGKRASNYEVIPLCPAHHQCGGHGVAVHAGHGDTTHAYQQAKLTPKGVEWLAGELAKSEAKKKMEVM